MKKIIFILTLCFMFCSTHIYAARFGSGKSFGQHRSSQSSQHSGKPQQQQQHQQQNQPHQTPPKSSFMSKFMPVLAGLSIGALLGSLLSGHGLGGGLGAMLLILAVAGIAFYVLKKLLASKTEFKNLNHFQNTATQTDTGQTLSGNTYQQPDHYYNSSNYDTSNNNALFNKEALLRTAKTTFIRMQNAYDNKNLDDIRNFTTPEVFAEIQMQILERGDAVNKTDVIQINASFMDEHESDNTSANILFSGQIREQQNAQPVEINEIWHFVKDDNYKWLIAGIKQKNNPST